MGNAPSGRRRKGFEAKALAGRTRAGTAGRWRAAWRCTLLSGLALAQKTASKTEIIGLQNLNENHDEASLVHSCIGTVRTLPSQHSNQRTGILVHGLQSPIAVRRTNFTVLFASSPPVSSTQAPGDRACHALMQGMVNHKETGDAFFSDLPPHFLRAVHRREV